MTNLKPDIRRFIVDTFLFGQENGLKDSDSFLANGIIDSTGVIELVAFLEKTHGLRIPDADLLPENLDSIDAIAGYIARRRGNATH